MTKNSEKGKYGNRLAKSCFSETNEEGDSSSNSDYSMEDRSLDNRMDDGGDTITQQNHIGHGTDEKTTYITVETREGKLQQLKINLDDENFSTSTSILEYLVEKGEINPKSLSVSQELETRGKGGQRRGSIFDVMRARGNDNRAIDLESIEIEDLTASNPTNSNNISTLQVPGIQERKISRPRSDSVITPGLIKNLKKNKKRIIAKGYSPKWSVKTFKFECIFTIFIDKKGGQCNIQLKNVRKKRKLFFKDIFTTAVDIEWRYTLLAFAAAFFVSWTVFAVLYWIIAIYRGDLEPNNLPQNQESSGWRPCVLEMYNFTSFYLFSVETQHTIGYGSRQTTEECPEAVILMSLQSVIGVVITSCMAGIVFAKLARPKNRSHTIMFSKNAVITIRNGEYHLLFRVGNMRKSHLIEAHCRAQVVHYKRVSEEGEMVQYDIEELAITTERKLRKKSFEYDDNGSELSESESDEEETKPEALLLWPTTVAHKIDKYSPFYSMGPKDILAARFELVVTLEGIVEPTGNSVQARSSFLPNEILWGHRYQNMMSYNKKKGVYLVDCSNLNAVVQDDTPRVSAKQTEEKRRLEAKRLAQLKRKISAISQNSVRSPNPKLSVLSPRNISKCQSMDECGNTRWNEEGMSASLTASTICDKSEMDGDDSVPKITVVNVGKRKTPISPPSYNTPSNSNIWVTNASGQASMLSNIASSGEQNVRREGDENYRSPNGRLVGLGNQTINDQEKSDGMTSFDNHECGGVSISMNENHIGVEINQ